MKVECHAVDTAVEHYHCRQRHPEITDLHQAVTRFFTQTSFLVVKEVKTVHREEIFLKICVN